MGKEAFIAKTGGGQLTQKTKLEPDADCIAGRSRRSCTLTFDSTRVSREHCVVSFDSGAELFLITDVSTNGTFLVSGERLEKGVPYTAFPQTEFYLSDPENRIILLTE